MADWSESLFGAAASNTTVSSEETESEPTFTDAILNGTVTFVSAVFLIVLFALYLIAQRSPRACAHRKAQVGRNLPLRSQPKKYNVEYIVYVTGMANKWSLGSVWGDHGLGTAGR